MSNDEITITQYRYQQLVGAENMQNDLIHLCLTLAVKQALLEKSDDVTTRAMDILTQWKVPFKFWRGTLDKTQIKAWNTATSVIEIWPLHVKIDLEKQKGGEK